MSLTKINVICVLGGPGAGKTTLCAALTNKIPNSVVLKSGSLIRAWINNNCHNGDGKHIGDVMDKGGLVDDGVVSDIINREVSKVISNGGVHSLIMDGFPRTLEQMRKFHTAEVNLCGVIVLEVPDLILEKRCRIRNLRTDRLDDLEQPVAERVRDYRQHAEAIVCEVGQQSGVKLLRLSTHGSVEETGQNAVDFALQLNLN